MKRNLQVRFLGEKGSATTPTYPPEEFKWIKQHLILQNPLTTSWTGLVVHLYLVLILFCLLLYFIALLQINQWELVISNIWIQLTSDPTVDWSFQFLNDYLLILSGIQEDRK